MEINFGFLSVSGTFGAFATNSSSFRSQKKNKKKTIIHS